MAECPSKWVESVNKYVRWREGQLVLMRQKSPSAAKVLVYSCFETPDTTLVVGDDCGGYADRLVGMVHLFVFSMLHGFVFMVDWSVATEQVAPQVFHSPFFNWTYDASVAVYGERTVYRGERHFMGCPDHQGPCPLMLDDPLSLFPHPVTLTRVNKGAIRYSNDESRRRLFEELGLELNTGGGCLIRTLVWPNAAVVEKFRAQALSLINPAGPRTVALHVRTGDKSMHQLLPRGSEFSFADEYWNCATKQRDELAQRTGAPARIFFSCDDIRYKREAVAKFGDAVMVTQVQPWHISKMQLFWDGFIHRGDKMPTPVERLMDTFGEWWLMSLSDVFVSPGWSGYSRTAFAYSQKTAAYNMHNYEGKGMFTCERTLTQADLAYLGGGY